MTNKVATAELITQSIRDLNDKWTSFQDEKQFAQLSYLRNICDSFTVSFNETGFMTGSAGDFIYDSAGSTVLVKLSDKFLGAWIKLLESVGDTRLVSLAFQVFVVHELAHRPQQLTSTRHQDIRHAPMPLTALDYHADMIAAIALAYLHGCQSATQWAEMFKATFYAAMVFDLRESDASGQKEDVRVYSVGRLRRLFLLIWHTCRLLRIGTGAFTPARMQFLHMPAIDFRNTRPRAIARYHSQLRLTNPVNPKAGISVQTGAGLQQEEDLYFKRLAADITPNLEVTDFRALVGSSKDIENPSEDLPLLWLVFLDEHGFPAVVRVNNVSTNGMDDLMHMLYGVALGPSLWDAANRFMRSVFDQAGATLMLPRDKAAVYIVNHLSGEDE